jgi:DNA repair ATPase RecN
MDSSIIVAIITGGLALLGVVATNASSNKTIDHKLDKAQAVTETKLDELTREVREHNNFARRIPVVEEQIKVINQRIGDLESARKD